MPVHPYFAWVLVAPFAVYFLYIVLTPVFERTAAQIK
jgi:thiosulfate reductase cytochrome b subunit